MVLEMFYNMPIRSLDGTPKILGSFFKMLKIWYGEDFKMSERISGTFLVCVYWSKNWTKKLTPPPATDEDNLSPPH